MNLMNNQNQFMGTVLGPAQAAAKQASQNN